MLCPKCCATVGHAVVPVITKVISQQQHGDEPPGGYVPIHHPVFKQPKHDGVGPKHTQPHGYQLQGAHGNRTQGVFQFIASIKALRLFAHGPAFNGHGCKKVRNGDHIQQRGPLLKVWQSHYSGLGGKTLQQNFLLQCIVTLYP